MLCSNVRSGIDNRGEALGRRDDHDRSAPGFDHGRNRKLCPVKAAFYMDIKYLIPHFRTGIDHAPIALNPSVAYQYVEATMTLHCLIDCFFHAGFTAYVTRVKACLVTGLSEYLDSCASTLRVAVEYPYGGPQLGQLLCGRGPNTHRAASDNGDFPVKSNTHLPAFFLHYPVLFKSSNRARSRFKLTPDHFFPTSFLECPGKYLGLGGRGDNQHTVDVAK